MEQKSEQKSERKYFIDNLRSLCILLLFPFHAAMIFVDFDESFYVKGTTSRLASMFNLITYSWWMSGLFALAGISTVYAFKHRTGKMYVKERVQKLFIPLVASILLLIPVQSYIADIFHNAYKGNYFEHFKVFFTVTDFTGYDGHFTPGHSWFILYLFMICLVTLPLLLWYNKRDKKIDGNKLTMPKLLLMFILIAVAELVPKIGGKSIGEFTACFLLGFFVLSIDSVQERLEKNSTGLGIAWVTLMVLRCVSYSLWKDGYLTALPGMTFDICWEFVNEIFRWVGILAMLGLGKRFLKFHTPLTVHFAKGSFPIYLFHQSILVIVGFFCLKYVQYSGLQYILITVLTFVLTIGLYEICRYVKPLRFLFGIKK